MRVLLEDVLYGEKGGMKWALGSGFILEEKKWRQRVERKLGDCFDVTSPTSTLLTLLLRFKIYLTNKRKLYSISRPSRHI